MVAEPTVETLKLDITNNWTGRDELPFEPIAERTLEIESHGERGPLTVTFAKPILIENLGWACIFRLSALGRVHVSPARGADAVEALQAAFAMVARQLAGMGRMHKIAFNGSDDLGFSTAETAAAKAAGCPVMSGSLS